MASEPVLDSASHVDFPATADHVRGALARHAATSEVCLARYNHDRDGWDFVSKCNAMDASAGLWVTRTLANALKFDGHADAEEWLSYQPADWRDSFNWQSWEMISVARARELTGQAPRTRPATLAEWVARQAQVYSDVGSEAGDLVAAKLDQLASEIRVLHATTVQDYYDRDAAYSAAC